MVKAIIINDISYVIEDTVVDTEGSFVLLRRTRKNLEDNRTVDELSDEKSKLRTWVVLS